MIPLSCWHVLPCLQKPQFISLVHNSQLQSYAVTCSSCAALMSLHMLFLCKCREKSLCSNTELCIGPWCSWARWKACHLENSLGRCFRHYTWAKLVFITENASGVFYETNKQTKTEKEIKRIKNQNCCDQICYFQPCNLHTVHLLVLCFLNPPALEPDTYRDITFVGKTCQNITQQEMLVKSSWLRCCII